MSPECFKLIMEGEYFVPCKRIQCLFNTMDSMSCTHDMDQITPNEDCKFYCRRQG